MGGPQSPLGYRNTPDWLGAGVGGASAGLFPSVRRDSPGFKPFLGVEHVSKYQHTLN